MINLWGSLVLGIGMGVALTTLIAAATLSKTTEDPMFRAKCRREVKMNIVILAVGLFMFMVNTDMIL